MEENFKKIIEEIKNSDMDPEETKRYILAIKRVFRKAFENCKDEFSEEEILRQCLQEYEKDLDFRGNASNIFTNVLIYNTYKRLLVLYKGDKAKFDRIVKEARRKESDDSTETLVANIDTKESMVSAIRSVIRNRKSINERKIVEAIQQEKGKNAGIIRDDLIQIIQTSVAELEEYGFIDEYIESSNVELQQLGLESLQFSKRNPIADEQYEHGTLVQDTEDIGVIDTFSTENLEKLPLSDLEILAAFWESKYMQERLGLSKAMSTIKTLDLWSDILKKEDDAILNLDNDRIIAALKKDLALTYLCKNEVEPTPKLRRHYKKFLKQNGMSPDAELEEDVTSILPEIQNLSASAKDIAILECLILYQIKEKDIKVKKCGVVKENTDENNGITLAIENPNFRGPLLMGVPQSIMTEFFTGKELHFPDYDKELDDKYCSIMSKLYLPINRFFTTTVKNEFKANPESTVLANLAGKKTKKGEER